MRVDEVAGLARQVGRVGEDAVAVRAHVERHCRMDWATQGLMLRLQESHLHAYRLVHGTLTALIDRVALVDTGIHQSIVDYGTPDTESADTFTAIGLGLAAGADQPTVSRDAVLDDRGARFTDLAEPVEVLHDPAVEASDPLFDINLVTQFHQYSSWVREACVQYLRVDPFEEMVLWLSGDWNAYERCLIVWHQVASACERMSRNLFRAAYQLPEVWSGREAGNAQRYLFALGNAVGAFAPVCREVGYRYRAAVGAAQNLNRVLADQAAEFVEDAVLVAGAVAAARYAPHPAAKVAAGVLAAAAGAVMWKRWKFVLDWEQRGEAALDSVSAWVLSSRFDEVEKLRAPEVLR